MAEPKPKKSESLDQEKGDEVLRRLLKTPPDPKTGKGKPAKRKDTNENKNR